MPRDGSPTGEGLLVLTRDSDGWEARGDFNVRAGNVADAPEPLFASWSWDGQRLSVENDRYGIVPMYCSVTPSTVVLATSVSAILSTGISRELDHDAIAVLERIGYFVGDDTHLRAVRRLPPGARVLQDRDSIRIEGGPWIPTPRPSLGRDEALDAYADLFRSAVASRLPDGPFVLPLSGGRDSRHILFALVEAGVPPDELVTVRHVPPKADEDARIAALLAEATGIRHTVLPRSPHRVEDEVRKNILTGFEAPQTHTWSLPLVDHLDGYSGVVFDGFGGDTLSMARYLSSEDLRLYAEGKLDVLADRILGSEAPVESLLTRTAYRAMPRDRAIGRVSRELELFAGAANPVRSFRFWSYSRRLIGSSPFGMLRGHRLRLPYLDTAVHDLLASLPPEIVMPEGGHFHTKAIERAYPEYSGIPYEDKDAPAVNDRPYYRRMARGALRYLAQSGGAGTLHDPAFVLPRLLRCAVDPRYSPAAGWLVPRAIYGTQLRRALA